MKTLIFFMTFFSALGCNPGFYMIGQQQNGQPICQPCQPGYYSGGGGQPFCQPCQPGYYSGGGGQPFCQPCQPGYYSGGGQPFCQPCQPGYYSGGGQPFCQPCQPGFSSGGGQSFCRPIQNFPYNLYYQTPSILTPKPPKSPEPPTLIESPKSPEPPTLLESPESPNKPSKPEKPSDSEPPKSPEPPTLLESPESPRKPSKSENPSDSEPPTLLKSPESPESPNKPSKPEKPSDSEPPESHRKPSDSEPPKSPRKPSKPENPSDSEPPKSPKKPSNSEPPESPNKPSNSESPKSPRKPSESRVFRTQTESHDMDINDDKKVVNIGSNVKFLKNETIDISDFSIEKKHKNSTITSDGKIRLNGKVNLNVPLVCEKNSTFLISKDSHVNLDSITSHGQMVIEKNTTITNGTIISNDLLTIESPAIIQSDVVLEVGSKLVVSGNETVQFTNVNIHGLIEVLYTSSLDFTGDVLINNTNVVFSKRKLLETGNANCIINNLLVMNGNGELNCAVINNGLISPDGTLSFYSLTLESTSILEFEVNDLITVQGDVNFDGIVKINTEYDEQVLITTTYGVITGKFVDENIIIRNNSIVYVRNTVTVIVQEVPVSIPDTKLISVLVPTLSFVVFFAVIIFYIKKRNDKKIEKDNLIVYAKPSIYSSTNPLLTQNTSYIQVPTLPE